MRTHIHEVFNSLQGEGIYAGARQVFVRFQVCGLRCNYCDSADARTRSPQCMVEKSPMSRDFRVMENPVDTQALGGIIENLWCSSARHVSLTGGEPLLQSDFILELSESVGHPLYLETNSAHPENARILKDIIDVAACDIKLPEHEAADNYDRLLADELETVRVFCDCGAETFVKLILLPGTAAASIRRPVEGIADISRHIPLVLQPATCKSRISDRELAKIQDMACELLRDVRVIPQMHKAMGWL